MLNAAEHELLSSVRNSLLAAGQGKKSAIVDQACTLLNCSSATLYRKLGEAGYDTNRKRRSDAGESVLSMDSLRLVSGVLMASTNQKGQRMPVQDALDILLANGRLPVRVSASTVSRQLYANHLHPDQLQMPSEAKRMTSLHPNHVWQVDSTTGAYYYLPKGRLRWMDEAEFNKNKVANLVKASTDLLTRYSVADHTSHAFKQRYYLGGESTQNLIEFLVWAMWKQETSPLHGAPHILMGDRGPANQSHTTAAFCKRLSIQLELHAPGNARATGSVEKSHDLARMHLETRFHFNDPMLVTLDRLNADAEAWAAAYCSTRVHTRHGRTRFGAWMEICRYPGALRVAASEEALREAAVGQPETPRVSNDKRISFKGKTYNLKLVPGAVAGLRVTVQMNVFRAPAIDVQFIDPDTGQETWHVVEPEVLNEWGYDGEHVIGQGFKGIANSVLDDNRNRVQREAYRTGDGLPSIEDANKARKQHRQAYAGQIDAMADVKATQVPAYLPRKGTPLQLPERRVEARRITVVEAAKAVRARLGEAYTPQMFSDIAALWPEGVPEDQVDALCVRLGQPVAERSNGSAHEGLRLIGGGAA